MTTFLLAALFTVSVVLLVVSLTLIYTYCRLLRMARGNENLRRMMEHLAKEKFGKVDLDVPRFDEAIKDFWQDYCAATARDLDEQIMSEERK